MFLLAKKAGQELSFGTGTSWHNMAFTCTARLLSPEIGQLHTDSLLEMAPAHTDPRAAPQGLLFARTEPPRGHHRGWPVLCFNPEPQPHSVYCCRGSYRDRDQKNACNTKQNWNLNCMFDCCRPCASETSFKAIFDGISKWRRPLCSFMSSLIGAFPWTISQIFSTNTENVLARY